MTTESGRFNSILVQLEVNCRNFRQHLQKSFNSILVQLEVEVNSDAESQYDSFNSILVQLEDQDRHQPL